MDSSDTILAITALGRFSISLNGKPVATAWPNETARLLFCSLLSPLDLYFSWDRISRSLWGIPASPTVRRRLMMNTVLPLIRLLTEELGFNPLIRGNEGIRIDPCHVKIDAFEFHANAVAGFKLLSLGYNNAAVEKFKLATELYAGSYMPEMTGKIIVSTRKDLEALYHTMVLDTLPRIQNASHSVSTACVS